MILYRNIESVLFNYSFENDVTNHHMMPLLSIEDMECFLEDKQDIFRYDYDSDIDMLVIYRLTYDSQMHAARIDVYTANNKVPALNRLIHELGKRLYSLGQLANMLDNGEIDWLDSPKYRYWIPTDTIYIL